MKYESNLPEDIEWLYAPDVTYAQRECGELRLQLIFPCRRVWEEDMRFPVILFIPGAAWYRQEMYNGVPQWAKLAEMGAVVAAVQVRGSTDAAFPAQVEDVLDAMRHLAKDAARWHIDPHRMYLMGQSSGGHIALMTVLREVDALAEAPDFTLRGVMAVSAPTDMQLCGGKPSLDLLGLTSFAEDPAKVREASTGGYISPRMRLPRILLMHGTADEVVPLEHSARLYRQLMTAGKSARFIKLAGVGHGGHAFWQSAVLESVMQFVTEG